MSKGGQKAHNGSGKRKVDRGGLRCTNCGGRQWVTLETRAATGAVRRRKECHACGHRVTTLEQVIPSRR